MAYYRNRDTATGVTPLLYTSTTSYISGLKVMSTSGGLSRRRVGANGGATSSYNDDDDNKLSPTNSGSGGGGSGGGGSRSTTPAPPQPQIPQHAHAGSAFEGGNKIAFDPRDLQQDASEEARTGGKLPRLTIMEEVLLLGIKDKQVCITTPPFFNAFFLRRNYNLFQFVVGLSVFLERQHFIRPTWLYSYRTSSPKTYRSSQRC